MWFTAIGYRSIKARTCFTVAASFGKFVSKANQLCCRVIENDSAKRLAIVEKEIAGLKDDMKSLRRKYRRLEEALGKSGGAVGPGPSALPAPLPAPVPAVLPREDRAALEASVAHLGRDSAKAIIKLVAQKLFTGQELETHFLMGKQSIKSGEVVRPPFDSVRLDMLEQLARNKCPELTHKLFVETLQNLQKVIRKKTAMAVVKAE